MEEKHSYAFRTVLSLLWHSCIFSPICLSYSSALVPGLWLLVADLLWPRPLERYLLLPPLPTYLDDGTPELVFCPTLH
jgi:hypothetical protein